MKPAVLLLIALACAASALGADNPPAPRGWSVSGQDDAIVVKSLGRTVAQYQLKKPAGVQLPVDSGAYFHPVTTPTGIVVTDVAPADHRHHRGIFLAWVEMHGKKDADFWGWGEHAPIKDRRVVNQSTQSTRAALGGGSFATRNHWVAEGETVVVEDLQASVKHDAPARAYVIDLTYTLTPDADLTLARWAFSGFCVRARGDGKVTAYSPAGEAKLPNPSHVKPESDWPDAPWYGYTLKFDDGKTAGVAVINHPQNPPTLWHNHRDIRMLNPCIVAPGEVKLKANEPLVLKYRVVAHDGETPREALDRLAKEWAEK
jgi:hypothetical protein